MSRSAPIIPVDAKMYRHFAIATVMITGCLAMFASGENREALEAQLAENQQQNAARQAEQEKAEQGAIGKKGNFKDKRKTKGSFTPDYALRDRTPNEARRVSGRALAGDAELIADENVVFSDEIRRQSGPENDDLDGPPPPGMSREEFASVRQQAE